MSTFVLLHGGGDSGWSWHLLVAELQALGHRVVAPDLPTDDAATLSDYADFVVEQLGDADDVVVVGHSFGGFTAPLVADRLPGSRLVFVAGMVPAPGETPDDWWTNTGYAEAVREQAALDGGLTGHQDWAISCYHDVDDDLAAEALRRERPHPGTTAYYQPWPLDRLPDVPTRFVLCTEDRMFPPAFMRRVVNERLGVTPEEIVSGHCPALAHPRELAELLTSP